jgi:hypothetical protein
VPEGVNTLLDSNYAEAVERPAALSSAFATLGLTGPGAISLDALKGLKKRRKASRSTDEERKSG